MSYLLCLVLANLVSVYEWQEISSPGIRSMEHCVVYDSLNNLFFLLGGDSTGYGGYMDICFSFDPETEIWDTNAPLLTKRKAHRCAYRNGFIHIFCGMNEFGKITSHEVYDIALDSWVTKASAPLAVTRPSVVTWKDSLIYIIGGYDVSSNARVEVYYYDPADDSWNPATSLPSRLHGGGAEIKGDSIFIVGGADGYSFYSEILLGIINSDNPAEINWFWGDSLPNPNTQNLHAMINNKIYMIGGFYNEGNNNEVWEYNRLNGQWTSLPDYPARSIAVGDFAKRGKLFNSTGDIYCFMGDTAGRSRHTTDKCYKLVEAVAVNDAGMYAINSPVSGQGVNAFVQVNGTVKNYGENTYSFKTYVNIYDPDSLIVFSDSAEVDDLSSLDTLNIDFGSFQLTKVGTYTVKMFTYALDDTYRQNDSLTATFNSSDCYWEVIAPSGVRAICHTVAYDPADDLFFIMGGDSTGYETNMDICLEFDPKTNTWDTRQPMYTAKRGHAAAYRKGFIHVLCGSDNYGNKLTYHEVYDISSDSWDLAAPASLPVTYPGAVTWRDSLVYLIGGYDTYHDARTEVYYYTPSTNSWDTATSLPRPLQGGGVKIKGDSIFIVGGADGFSYYSEILFGVINQAEPSEINWSWGNPLPISENARNGFAIKNNKLFMIGGAFDIGINEAGNMIYRAKPGHPFRIILQIVY